MPSLILGSAQFGSAYGVTNEAGQVPPRDVAELLAHAHSLGFDYVDTAANYGMAEEVIGDSLVPMKVGTKVAFRNAVSLRDQVELSMGRLRVSRIVQVLIHDWCQLSVDEKRAAARGLEEIRDEGMVERCGVSIYSEAEFLDAAALFDQLDVVQLPVSVLDRRFGRISIDVRDKMPALRIEGRSIFLQGLLAEKSGPDVLRSHPCIERWHTWCLSEDLSPVTASLSFAMAQDWLDCLVVGVTSVDQWDDIMRVTAPVVECLRTGEYVGSQVQPCEDVALLDPRHWTKST